MESLLRQVLPLMILGCIASVAVAQSGDQKDQPSDPQTVELVREAVANLGEQRKSGERFTYFELARTQNHNPKGKVLADRSVLTEMTYLGGLPYGRVVEIDGKPLTGKALVDEQARYDQAVKDRAALDTAARARIDKQVLIDAGLPYPLLTTRFHLADTPQQSANGETIHLLDASPLPAANSGEPMESRHLQLWIAATGPGTSPHLTRADFDYLTDDGDIQRGSSGRIDFIVVDGITLPEHKAIHSKVLYKGQLVLVDVDRTYSRYRRFGSAVRILPGSGDATSPQP